LKSILIKLEKKLEKNDKLVLKLFDGPFILNNIFLESFSLSNIRKVLKDKMPKSKKKFKFRNQNNSFGSQQTLPRAGIDDQFILQNQKQ
jgi:hypothetical protein